MKDAAMEGTMEGLVGKVNKMMDPIRIRLKEL